MKSLLAMGFMASALILISARRFDSAKVFRAKPHNEKQVNFLKNLPSDLQIDFWYPDSALHILSEMEVDFHISADQAKYVEILLKQNGIPYEILFQNLQEDIEKQLDNKNKSTGKYHYTKYNEWHQISAWTARIAKKYPKLVSRIKIGNTFENRPMYLLKV